MTKQELLTHYIDHPQTLAIADSLHAADARIQLKGLVGSSDAFVASAVLNRQPGTHLFILNDKEEAAYFFNDLESINEGDAKVFFFPAAYRRPYQIEETDNSNVLLRAEVLNEVNRRTKRTIIVTYGDALHEQVVTRKHLSNNTLEIKSGETYSIDFITELMHEYEFHQVDYVYEPGQFAVRGGIVDVFSFSNEEPYRIEFFGDEVDSIRSFDPSSQLSTMQLKKINIVPNVQQKLLMESRQTFLEYLPESTVIWLKNKDFAVQRLQKDFEVAESVYAKLDSPLKHLKPEELYNSSDNFERNLQKFALVEFGQHFSFEPKLSVTYKIAPQPNFNKNFDLLIEDLKEKTGSQYLNLITVANPKQVERLYRIFEDKESDVKYTPIVLSLHEGFIDRELKLACYTDHQIFERYHRFRLKEGFKKNQAAFTLKELNNLQKGDFVVHIDHGIGKFSGLESIDANGKKQEAIRLLYKNNDILYVSIHSLHRISKYTGKDGTQPGLHKLGSGAWQKAKSKTKSKVKEIAYDLIQLYAKRKAQKGFAYTEDTYLQNELEASFIYEDTPDQLTSTQDIKRDMENIVPMDRLICGDVGFGKTELAIRAAFKAVADSKQVAILVPTTILTFQHYKTFSARLEEMPCKVEYINRFRSPAKIKQVLQEVEAGRVDILIGTHRIVGKDVKFKDLGLLVIDEEQKFGVGVKDKLKTMKVNVDTLTLTATPIPRTLQFSMMGARDLSVLRTPPPNRHPVDTLLAGFSEETFRDAILYEIKRGGQVYFVHNRVQNITEVQGMLQRICPDVRIAVGHGQMEGKKLENIMVDFMDGLYDVLLATTIIESGIDVPNANTIIINQAQNFGLSDLHQLRGRVGRSNKKAFSYLITPPLSHVSDDTRKRLNALIQISELGSGFNISMRDLDLRGAGNLLGGEQSGFISDIGFETYKKILDEAIQELKENEFKDLFEDEEPTYTKGEFQLETDLEILIPDNYVNQIAERLNLYRKLDEIDNETELAAFGTMLEDRFGPVPDATQDLLNSVRLRWIALEVGFERLVLKRNKLIGYFISNQESPYYQSDRFSRVIEFIKNYPQLGEMSEKNDRLRFAFPNIESIDQAMKILLTMNTIELPASTK